jgi:hypothetical protein
MFAKFRRLPVAAAVRDARVFPCRVAMLGVDEHTAVTADPHKERVR